MPWEPPSWTDDDCAILRERWMAGHSAEDIAGQLGRTACAVRHKARKLRLPTRRGHVKPALGYPSRHAAIVALSRKGYSGVRIARMLGCTPEAVYWARSEEKRNTLAAGRQYTVALPGQQAAALEHEANRRGIKAELLAQMLLEAVASDTLFGAILDAGEEEAA